MLIVSGKNFGKYQFWPILHKKAHAIPKIENENSVKLVKYKRFFKKDFLRDKKLSVIKKKGFC